MNNKLYKLMNWPEIEEIIYSDGDNPHRILGAHKVGNSLLIQTFQPDAKNVTVVTEENGKKYEMELADEAGFYAALVPVKEGTRYHYEITNERGENTDLYDPYFFEPLLDREDCIKFNSGIHYHIDSRLGAHPMKRDGIRGVNFAVWAPEASRVSVIGNFNNWDGRIHQMRRLEPTGIFEIFVPEVNVGDEYQFEIRIKSGQVYRRPDPYMLRCKDTSGEISIVSEIGTISWEDDDWITARKKYNKQESPLSICEMALDRIAEECALAGESTNYRNLAQYVCRHMKACGFNALELLPVMEHTEQHRYDVTGYFALKSAYGTAQDFMAFVNEMHKDGIRVILDFPVTFFQKTETGLACYDGSCLYEYADPAKAMQPGTDRLIFDYGRKQVTNYLLSCALFWIENFHIDGFRLTDISKALYLDYDRKPGEWTPNIYGGNENLEAVDFVKHLVSMVNKVDPGLLMITKETACWPQLTDSQENGGLGFDYKWNNGWTHDYLGYIQNDPIYRSAHHNELTFSIIYCYTERFILTFSHEDIGGYSALKSMMPGNEEQRQAGVRMSFAYLMTHPGKKMIYHGKENLPEKENLQMQHFISDLNRMYFEHPALYEYDHSEEGFEWINCMAAELCMLSFIRRGKQDDDVLLVVMNMAGIDREFTIGVPSDGRYQEILCTDDASYGGSGMVNDRKIEPVRKECDGRQYSINIHMAPLSLSVFSFTTFTEQEKQIRRIREEAQMQMEQERQTRKQVLITQKQQEEEKLLNALKKKYEEELAQQEKAIQDKYVKIEEEQIYSIVTEMQQNSENGKKAVSGNHSTDKKTQKPGTAGKKTTEKSNSSKKATEKKNTKET